MDTPTPAPAPGDGTPLLNLPTLAQEVGFTSDLALVLFAHSPDAIVVVDHNGLIQMVNNQFELLLGYHRSEIRGKPVETLIPAALREAHKAHRADFFEEPRLRPMGVGLKLEAQRKDGSVVGVDINLSPIMTSRGLYVIATLRRKQRQP